MKNLYRISAVKNTKVFTKKYRHDNLSELVYTIQNKGFYIIKVEVWKLQTWKEVNYEPTDYEKSQENIQKNTKESIEANPNSNSLSINSHIRKSNFKNTFSAKIPPSFYFEQIALLLESYIPIDESIRHVQNLSKAPFSERFELILESLKKGYTLTQSFKHLKLPELYESILLVGEKTGKLQESFDIIAKDIQGRENLKKRLRKILFYPLLVSFSLIVCFLCAIMIILPEFVSFFEENNANLPLITKSLLWLEFFLKSFWMIILFILLGWIVVHLWLYKQNQAYRMFIDRNILLFPILGPILTYNALFHFFHSLYFLQVSGSHIKDSLRISQKTLKNSYLKSKINLIIDSLDQGISITQSMRSCQIFSSMVIGFIEGGEKSGNLDRMLKACSMHYKKICQERLDKILLWIEPASSFFLAILVLYLALGIFLPIWNLQSIAME